MQRSQTQYYHHLISLSDWLPQYMRAPQKIFLCNPSGGLVKLDTKTAVNVILLPIILVCFWQVCVFDIIICLQFYWLNRLHPTRQDSYFNEILTNVLLKVIGFTVCSASPSACARSYASAMNCVRTKLRFALFKEHSCCNTTPLRQMECC